MAEPSRRAEDDEAADVSVNETEFDDPETFLVTGENTGKQDVAPLGRWEKRAWIFYDFATNCYSTVAIGFFMPLLATELARRRAWHTHSRFDSVPPECSFVDTSDLYCTTCVEGEGNVLRFASNGTRPGETPDVRISAGTVAIDPRKDVDSLHPFSVGSLALRNVDPTFEPATAKGVMELMRRHRVSTHNARCVILGNSNSVGLPLGFLLRDAGAKSVATLPRDDAIGDEGKRLGKAADLIFAAVGSPHCISTEHASAGASIVDVGINAHPVSNDPATHQRNEEQKMQRQRVESQQWSECSNETARYQWPLSSDGSFRVAGDVCMEPLINHGCNVTPVPGGAGPMTVAALLQNLLTSAETRYRSEMHQQSSSALLS
jgi:5,10-methylene-tetrahydrofolate dehydrogenase/methenyl tetrahydrofolate cyclohydrolase